MFERAASQRVLAALFWADPQGCALNAAGPSLPAPTEPAAPLLELLLSRRVLPLLAALLHVPALHGSILKQAVRARPCLPAPPLWLAAKTYVPCAGWMYACAKARSVMCMLCLGLGWPPLQLGSL